MKYSGCNEVAESKVDYEKEYHKLIEQISKIHDKFSEKDITISALAKEVKQLRKRLNEYEIVIEEV